MDELIGLVHEELLRLAFAIGRRDPGATQRSETLVHETWIRLKDLPHLARLPASELMAIAAGVMRQVLWTDPTNWMRRVVALGPPFQYRYVLGDTTDLADAQDDGYIRELLH